ncbi:hypothetical protein ACN3VN_03165 [Xylella fastidiosa]|uniref:hypothetical protein n=1 Tax=Xylella fastidiosa TaxID=2371 RepID=UPI0012D9948B|nr:hypothetical protein [Xylella fastidiosa]
MASRVVTPVATTPGLSRWPVPCPGASTLVGLNNPGLDKVSMAHLGKIEVLVSELMLYEKALATA